MDESAWLAQRFETHRSHLRAVAYRMLGSLSDADDAVQEAWLRLDRSGADGVDNLGGWLTTVVARVCLDMLRTRDSRREQAWGARVPDPIVAAPDGPDPEQEALLADSVGLAMLVVLDTLAPAERLAFVLHDLFAVPFDEIATVLGRSPAAARQLASRARRRVRADVTTPEPDLARQRRVVDAFLAASRAGDFDALLTILDPEAVLRADGGAAGGIREVRGAAAVARQVLAHARLGGFSRPALVNGAAGLVVVMPGGRLLSVLAFTVTDGRIAEIDIVADPRRLRDLDSAFVGARPPADPPYG